jgi:hypothetical protein
VERTREPWFAGLRAGAFPFAGLTEYDVRVALHEALGVLDDHGFVDEFVQRAEEAITEAKAQAMEP